MGHWGEPSRGLYRIKGLRSKLVKGGYIEDYIGDCYSSSRGFGRGGGLGTGALEFTALGRLGWGVRIYNRTSMNIIRIMAGGLGSQAFGFGVSGSRGFRV